jgi:hypothetical protein
VKRTAVLGSPIDHAVPCPLAVPMSRLIPSYMVLPARPVLAFLSPLSPDRHTALFRAQHSNAMPRLLNITWLLFPGPRTLILSSYWSYDLVHECWQFHSKDGPVGTESYSLFPIYTGLATGEHSACHLLARWFAELFFDPEDGGDTFLRNVGCNSTDYTASYPRR